MLSTIAAFLLVAVGLLCGLPIRYLVRQEWPVLRRSLYFPIAGQPRWEHRTQRERLLRNLGGIELALKTDDGREVHCVFIEAAREGGRAAPPPRTAADLAAADVEAGGAVETPVALLLHANAMVLDDMADWAQYYLALGVSVCLVTFWGYPDPAEDDAPPERHHASEERGLLQPGGEEAAPTERGMYLDAEAALRYVLQARRVPVERTLVHGLSIGGGVASALGVHHPGLKVTLDQTFTSLYDVSVHVGAGLYDQLVMPRAPKHARRLLKCCQPLILRAVAAVLVRMLFKTGAAEQKGLSCARLDRMDNVAKAGSITGDVFVIYAEHDEMMEPSCAPAILQRRYAGAPNAAELERARLLCVPGGHCCFFGDVPELAHKYTAYLEASGFLPR